jgi:hypothetical protein
MPRALLDVEPARALAVWQRKAADASAAPVSRGAALGASLSLAGRTASTHTITVAITITTRRSRIQT